jgi:hypothetical protein
MYVSSLYFSSAVAISPVKVRGKPSGIDERMCAILILLRGYKPGYDARNFPATVEVSVSLTLSCI